MRRLPEMIATSSAKIELAPDILLKDCDQLRARLQSSSDRFVLIGRRHLRSNNSWFHNIRSLAKGPQRCTLQVHPEDARALKLTNGDLAIIESFSD